MTDESTYESIYVARQPILDANNDTWGYMMLFRDSDNADRAIFSSNSEATMNLVANLPLCGGVCGNQARLLIHFHARGRHPRHPSRHSLGQHGHHS